MKHGARRLSASLIYSSYGDPPHLAGDGYMQSPTALHPKGRLSQVLSEFTDYCNANSTALELSRKSHGRPPKKKKKKGSCFLPLSIHGTGTHVGGLPLGVHYNSTKHGRFGGLTLYSSGVAQYPVRGCLVNSSTLSLNNTIPISPHAVALHCHVVSTSIHCRDLTRKAP